MRAVSEFVINNWFVLTSHILSHQKVLEQTKPNNGTKQGNLHKLNLAKKKVSNGKSSLHKGWSDENKNTIAKLMHVRKTKV